MVRIVRLSFQPEHTDDFIALFEARKLNIRAVAGCTHLELWRDQERSNVFYTYSHWEGPEDLENYRVSEFFKNTWQTIKPWFNAPAQAFSTQVMQTLP